MTLFFLPTCRQLHQANAAMPFQSRSFGHSVGRFTSSTREIPLFCIGRIALIPPRLHNSPVCCTCFRHFATTLCTSWKSLDMRGSGWDICKRFHVEEMDGLQRESSRGIWKMLPCLLGSCLGGPGEESWIGGSAFWGTYVREAPPFGRFETTC